MFREKIKELEKWKLSEDRKPLIIRGARQVGKTWLMKEFGSKFYSKCAYVNFENNEAMKLLFEGDIIPERIINALKIETKVDITPNDTLIIFDEIQAVPRALTSLKYFCETANEYHIVAAGSLLGVALHEGTSFPVGKVSFLDLYPLNYVEFLTALGEEGLAKAIYDSDIDLLVPFKNKLIEYLKIYYYVGGMPNVVETYIKSKNMENVRNVQNDILNAYEQDFSKHAPSSVVPRIRQLWKNIPTQLAKENKKFIYGLIREGARAREYEIALSWLLDCGLVYQVSRIKKPDVPLAAYQDFSAFKLYVLDVGLLCAMSGIDSRSILDGNKMLEEFKGSLTEQYVLQQLRCSFQNSIFYWSSEKGSGEIDFLIQLEKEIVPIEVKAEENLMAKSLRTFANQYNTTFNVRTSMSNYKCESWMVNIPLYLIGQMEKIYGQIEFNNIK